MRDERDALYEENVILKAIFRFLECPDPEQAEIDDLVRVYGSEEEVERHACLAEKERKAGVVNFDKRLLCVKRRL